MATSIDIVNQALAHLGNKANVASIDPPDGSVEANLAARFYSTALYRALEREDWSFARARVELATLDNPSSVWLYAYAMPSNCLKARRILTDDATQYEDDTEPFKIEGDKLLTNKADAVLLYTQPITEPAKFLPSFCDTFAAELAAYLAGPILRGAEGVKAAGQLRQMAAVLAAQAAASDANTDQRPADQFVPGSIGARG